MKKLLFVINLIVMILGVVGKIPAYGQLSPYEKILPNHPRIIINEYNRPELRKKITWKLSSVFQRFIDAQHNPGEDTQAICRYVYSQAYAYQMTGEVKWADKAIAVMEKMPELFAKYGTLPDSAAHCLEALAIGYDWCYDRIVQAGKKQRFVELINVFVRKTQQEFEKGIYVDFHNYATNFEVAVLFAGLALYREDERAVDYLDWARGIVETGYQLNRTTYKLIDSINYVDGACNWENSSYQRISLFAIIKYIDGWDTATGGAFDAWNTTFKSIENAGYYFIYSVQPNNVLAPLGDNAYLEVNYKDINNLAALQGKFKNPYFTTFLDKYFCWESGKFTPVIPCDQGNQLQIFYLLWYDPYIKPKPLEELPLSRKFGNDIFMRTGWGEQNTYITFRAGIHWGGHSHLDHGSLTIYKNNPLVIDSGYYDLWNPGIHIWDYWKRTIAHNTILIYDPEENWPSYAGKRLNDGGQRMAFRKYNPPYTDHYGYFSSGSTNEPLSIQYLNKHIDEFKMGEIKAYEATNTYDYIRTDLTNAYNNSYSGKGDNQKIKTSLVQREFVFLRPDYVVILDKVNAIDTSFTKSWLLHFGKYSNPVNSAPYIKESRSWVRPEQGISEYHSDLVRIDNGNGRLFCKTLLPYPHKLRGIGGRGYEFWVNGQNISIAAESIREDAEPGAWRIEVQPTIPQKDDIFLHILYPCDLTVESMPEVDRIETDGSVGLQIADRVVIFSRDKKKLSYQVNGNTLKHIVCNLHPDINYNVLIKSLNTEEMVQQSVAPTASGILEFSGPSFAQQIINISVVEGN